MARSVGPLGDPAQSRLELTLDDADLGALHLGVSAEGEAVHLHLQADRPETGDLLRRNADLLMRDLRDLGYAQVNLSFGAGGDTGGRTPRSGAGLPAPPADAPHAAPPPPAAARAVGRLDLRL